MNAKLRETLLACRSWTDLVSAANSQTDYKATGELFEQVVLAYLTLDPTYQALLDNVWLLKDVPPDVSAALDLGDGDIGIDLVCKTREGHYWAVQAKYRQDPSLALSWKKDLSTFAGLVAGRPFEQALVATTTIDISERSKQGLKGRFGFLKADVWARLDEEFFSLLAKRFAGKKAKLKPRNPLPHQGPAVDDVVAHFAKKARGKLLMACGTGKTLTSFFVAERMKARKVLIAVPNLGLARQVLREWMREYVARGERPRTMVVCSDQSVANDEDLDTEVTDLGIHVTTSVEEATEFFRADGDFLVVTTYHSGATTSEAARAAGVVFDLGIFDEAHKTVGEKGKAWSHLLFEENIPLSKRLFMTATERVFRNSPEGVELVDMDDVEHYGSTAHSLTFLQALNRKLLCDYRVVTLETTTARAKKLLSDRRIVFPKGHDRATRIEMLAAALELLDGMLKFGVHRVIAYHSSVKRARAFEHLLASLLLLPRYRDMGLKTFHLNGSDSAARRFDVLGRALLAPYSVVTNCRCLTEGIDVPAIDGIAFIDAKQSKVDIVQAVGRAIRRADGKQFGYVFVPAVVRQGDDLDDLTSGPFAATAQVIAAMGTMDENIVAMVDAIGHGREWAGARTVPFNLPVGVHIDPEEFGRELALRVHARLNRFQEWAPAEQVRAFVRKGRLDRAKYRALATSGELPTGFPLQPTDVYGKPWSWFSGRVANQNREFPAAEVIQAYFGEHHLTQGEYRARAKAGRLPKGFPKAPHMTYQKPWSWFTGRETREYVAARVVREYVRKHDLNSTTYTAAIREGSLPKGFPATPWQVYEKPWSWFTGVNRDWAKPEVVRDYIREHGILTRAHYQRLFSAGKLPRRFPSLNLTRTYDRPWTWFTGEEPKEFVKPEVVRAYIRKNGLNQVGYQQLGTARPKGFPANIRDVYGRPWSWFTGTKSSQGMEWAPASAVRTLVRRNGLNRDRYAAKFKSGKLPLHFPSNPSAVYAKPWSWFSGKVANQNRTYVSADEVRSFLQKRGLTAQGYLALSRHRKLPRGFPSSPVTVFKKPWAWFTGNDFKNQTWALPTAVRSFFRDNQLTLAGYRDLSKEGALPKGFPKDPSATYGKLGSWFTGNDLFSGDRVAAHVVRDFVRAKGLTQNEYSRRSRGRKLPSGFPGAPTSYYEKPWSWFSGRTVERPKIFSTAGAVRAFVRERNLTLKGYMAAFKAREVPGSFPFNPLGVYGRRWSWFSGRPSNSERQFVSPETVRAYFRKHSLRQRTYLAACREGRVPSGFPFNPSLKYGKPWAWFTGRARNGA